MHLPTPPRPDIKPRKRWIPSLIWLVPLICALIGVALVVKSVTDKGPTVTVTFSNAEGMEAGKTKVKYKDVEIGSIQAVALSKDLQHVIVTIELTKQAEKFASRGTRFWVVRPRVGANGISGSVPCCPARISVWTSGSLRKGKPRLSASRVRLLSHPGSGGISTR